MRKYFTICLLFFGLFFFHIAGAQQYDESFAVQGIAMAGQSAALGTSFNPIGNPALMPLNKRTSFGLSVYNKFFLANLKQGGFGMTHKLTKTDVIGVVMQFNGTPNLKQSNIALAYSKKINEKFNAGISFIYLNTFEQSLGSKNNFLAKAGIVFRPSSSFLIGATVYNPLAAKFSKFSNERIPTYISAGICYKVSRQVKVYSEYKLGLNEVRNLKLGLSYEPKPGFIFFAGYQNTNSPLSFGFTFKTKNLNINIATQYHQLLGFSPAIGMDCERD